VPTIPTCEPDTFTAGETLQWTRSFPAYPASTYTLKYALQMGATLLTIVASASANDFAVTVADTTTAAFPPGVYLWTAFAETSGGATRTVIARGALTILPSPLIALGTTHASRMLGLIEAALENRIPNGLQSTDIDGQRIDRIDVPSLFRLRDKYRAKVLAEQKLLAAQCGRRGRQSIGIRFTRP
jgi:hypothetical protein